MTNRISNIPSLLGSLCCLLCIQNLADASVIVAGDVVRIDTDQGAASGLYGGEYALYKKSGPGDEDWEFIAKTFCLERRAPIDTGRDVISGEYYQYVVASVSDRAIDDGSSTSSPYPPNTPDYLSIEAKFLYQAHQTGVLDSYTLGGGVNFQYGDDGWAQSLQNAIWELEDEGVYGSGADEALLVALANAEAANYFTQNDDGVFALNLFESDADLSGFDIDNPSTWNAGSDLAGFHIQDLFWYTPPPNPVPEPTTLAVWSFIGLGGVGFMARRRLKRQTKS